MMDYSSGNMFYVIGDPVSRMVKQASFSLREKTLIGSSQMYSFLYCMAGWFLP